MKILLTLIFHVQLIAGFATLEQAQHYANRMTEYPPITQKNVVLNPDYTSWYRAHKPSLLDRFFSFFTKEDWAVRQFKELLTTELKRREDAGYSNPHALVMKPMPASEFALIGPLFGSFHSLVRILSTWRKEGFISSAFKIIKPNFFVVFDGNVIDGYPLYFRNA